MDVGEYAAYNSSEDLSKKKKRYKRKNMSGEPTSANRYTILNENNSAKTKYKEGISTDLHPRVLLKRMEFPEMSFNLPQAKKTKKSRKVKYVPGAVRRSERIKSMVLKEDLNQVLPVNYESMVEKTTYRHKTKISMENKKSFQKKAPGNFLCSDVMYQSRVPEAVEGTANIDGKLHVLVKWKDQRAQEYIPMENLTENLKSLLASFNHFQFTQMGLLKENALQEKGGDTLLVRECHATVEREGLLPLVSQDHVTQEGEEHTSLEREEHISSVRDGNAAVKGEKHMPLITVDHATPKGVELISQERQEHATPERERFSLVGAEHSSTHYVDKNEIMFPSPRFQKIFILNFKRKQKLLHKEWILTQPNMHEMDVRILI